MDRQVEKQNDPAGTLFDFFVPPSRFECYLQKKRGKMTILGITTFKI
jgi:hypothetical protein